MNNHKCFLCGNWYDVFGVTTYGMPATEVCWKCIQRVVMEAIKCHKENPLS